MEGEIEDIEALVEAAASLGSVVARLAVYEIPYDSSDEGVRRWREYGATLSVLLSAGRRGDAIELFMRLVGASDAGVEGMRAALVRATFESRCAHARVRRGGARNGAHGADGAGGDGDR